MIDQALHKRVQTYLDLAELSRNDHSVATIHDFRVSARNLLAVEPLLRCVSETSQWKKIIRKYLKSLGQLRDTQVLYGNLNGHDRFDRLLLEQMKQSLEEWRKISKNIADPYFQNKLNTSIEIYCSDIKSDPPLFNQTAASQWSKTFQKVKMAIHEADHTDPPSLHKLRIRYKSMRYLATFLYGAGVVEILDIPELKYWQTLLGDIQDLEVRIKWIEEFSNRTDMIEQLKEESANRRQKYSDQEEQLEAFITKIDRMVRSGIEKLELPTQIASKN